MSKLVEVFSPVSPPPAPEARQRPLPSTGPNAAPVPTLIDPMEHAQSHKLPDASIGAQIQRTSKPRSYSLNFVVQPPSRAALNASQDEDKASRTTSMVSKAPYDHDPHVTATSHPKLQVNTIVRRAATFPSTASTHRPVVDTINDQVKFETWVQERIKSKARYLGQRDTLHSLFREAQRNGEDIPSSLYKLDAFSSTTEKLRQIWAQSLRSDKEFVGDMLGFWNGLVNVLKTSYLNLLLIFLPISVSLYYTIDIPLLVFAFLYLTTIALGSLIGIFTEDLAKHYKTPIGLLISCTLGTSVELVSAAIALSKCELRLVQSTLVGTILCNLLLVLGSSFVVGGIKFAEQGVSFSFTQTASSVLVTMSVAITFPMVYYFIAGSAVGSAGTSPASLNTYSNLHSLSIAPNRLETILRISRGAAVILCLLYILYLVLQLISHCLFLYDAAPSPSIAYAESIDIRQLSANVEHRLVNLLEPSSNSTLRSSSNDESRPESNALKIPDITAGQDSEKALGSSVSANKKQHLKESTPQLKRRYHVIFLVILIATTAYVIELLITTMDKVTEPTGLSKEFVGLFLLPLLSGNISERVKLVGASLEDHLDRTVKVAIGSTIQIAFWIIPILILGAWATGKPLTLFFDPLECLAVFLCVLTLNYTLADGKTTWFEGALLLALYVLFVFTFVYYPGFDPEGTMFSCSSS